MGQPSRNPHQATPVELRDRLALERGGRPFLICRDADGAQVLVTLDGDGPATIGRGETAAVSLPWDERVSRVHAQLMRLEDAWLVVDDGLSRNGTRVNGDPLAGRRRLRDGDQLEVGGTLLVFRDPADARAVSTAVARATTGIPDVTPAQRRVLVALCRPVLDGDDLPAGNQEIAAALHLSLPAVKAHLGAMFSAFGLTGLAPTAKRVALVRVALDAGLVSRRDAAMP